MKKKLLKVLSVLLAVVLTFTAAPLSGFVGLKLPDWFDVSIDASAEDSLTSGTCGENLTWDLDKDIGTLTISGIGKMDNFPSYNRPWENYKESVKSIVIEDGATYIGLYAFYDFASLISVILPDTVTSIGNYAFGYCTSLASITIPDSVTTIGNDAFSNCYCLESVTIGDSVTTIGANAFYFCDSLTSVIFPDGVTSIGIYAFSGCTSLTSVTLPNSLTLIEQSTFLDCTSLTSIIIPDSVTSIDAWAFENCSSLTSVTIGESVITIGYEAFKNCTNLTNMIIPDGVKSIGDRAFYNCDSLTSVEIPDSVTSIGSNAFFICNSLTSVTIGYSVTSICSFTFYECRNLASIIIPEGVTSIGNSAFRSCYNLSNVYYSGTEEQWNKITIDDYNECLTNATIHYNSTGPYSGNEICNECGGTCEAVVTEPTCENMGYITYICSLCQNTYNVDVAEALGHDLTKVIAEAVVPSCTVNGKTILMGCTRCDYTQGGNIIAAIGHNMQETVAVTPTCEDYGVTAGYICGNGCGKTEGSERIPPTGHSYSSYIIVPTCTKNGYTIYTCLICGDEYTADEVSALEHNYIDGVCEYCAEGSTNPSGTCGENVSWVLNPLTGIVTISGKGAMNDYRIFPYGILDKIKQVIIKDGITSIGANAFHSCYNLTSVTIPDSVILIGDEAFEGCEKLFNVNYSGSEAQWNNISILGFNKQLLNSIVFCKDNTICPSGTFGGNLTWRLDETGTLTISGTGKMNDLTMGYRPWEYCIYNIKKIILCEGVTSIESSSFEDCINLTNVMLPDSLTSINGYAFAGCSKLTSIFIPKNVDFINTHVFIDCTSLEKISVDTENEYYSSDDSGVLFEYHKTNLVQYPMGNTRISYTVPDTVIWIRNDSFLNCDNLTKIIIPNSVTKIESHAFLDCNNLKEIIIDKSVTKIEEGAFGLCDNLSDVYYSGTEEQWSNITINSGNECLISATIHYNSNIPDSDETGNSFSLSEDLVFLDKNEYFKLSALSDDGTDITDYLTWKTSDASIVEIISSGYIRAKGNGLVTISAEKSYSEMDYCYVYVGDPNHIKYNTVYDKDYYYSGDGFYSNAAQISNAVDIYLSLENCVADEMQSMYDKDALLGTYEDEYNSLEVGEFTVTATVSGNDLSFSNDSYSNTYSETFSNIPIETIVDDILVLYPYGLTVNGDKKSYTVNVKIESDDFETIEDTITFSVSDLVSKAANEHIDFLDANLTYKTSLHNSYGTNMVKLKDDEEYKFSKYSTFDFDNYYEIVVGDLLIDVLNVQQTGNISLLPTVVSEYNSVINNVISTINTIVYDDYGEALNISETAIDKFIKTSKYRDDGIYAENVAFQAIQKVCGNTDNSDKINKVFAAADKTKQVCKFLNFGLDTINNIIDFTNRISVFNAYNDASNSFKEVFEKLYESIPASKTKMREAVKDYINFADNGFTMTAEIIEAYGDLSKKVGADAITTYLGKSFIDLTSGMVCEWIGSITLSSGATFASTAAFATVQAAFGGFLTGAAIGLCLTDLCCNSSEKAAEMGKIIAMSEYSPYIIEMVKYYENNLRTNKNDYAVELFEHAFAIHKVSQVYITEHTIKALEIKRDSIIENLFDRKGEYEQVIADTLSIKYQLENMICHSNDTTASVVRKTKVIAIKCPVDVFVYEENGNIVVEIRNNILKYCADGIEVCISDSKKYICVPAENEYEVKIVSTGEGTMDYIVYEYDESAELQTKKEIDNIPLSIGKEFNGTIYETDENNQQNHIYSLISDNDEYFTQENICIAEGHTTSVINYSVPSCVKMGYSGDVYCENCQRIIEYGESINAISHKYENDACTVCSEKDPSHTEEPEYNYTFSIQTPSRTEIRNKDGIILHAIIDGNTPDGCCVRWESSNGNFDKSADGSTLKIIAKNKGYTTFTAILCDADGNELARDSVEMYSKSGFFDKIGGFFRSIFGTTKIYDN